MRNERIAGHSRVNSGPTRRLLATIFSAVMAGITGPGVAGPDGANIVGGTGSIKIGGKTTTIHQDSDLMAIDWDSYNVNVDERVHYIQPDASSISLNRILSNQGSQIQGQIDANGQVILVNPNGIIFGANATVNAGGLLASGLDIQPEDFMNQDFAFSALDNAEGKVINAGLLNAATGGSVSLLGKQVKNEGLIVANLGAVNLVAGQDAVVTFDSNGLMGVRVTGDLLQNELGMEEAVVNSGDIQALGGQILLSARVSEDIFTQAVHIDDQARSVVVHDDGSFTLGGSDVRNSGTLDVSSPSDNRESNANRTAGRIVAIGDTVRSSGQIFANAGLGNADPVKAGQTAAGSIELNASTTTELLPGSITTANATESGVGGEIKLLGSNVGVLGASQVEASGANGGGEILIGGDITGQNAWVPNAEFTYVAEQASIRADGIKAGDGGKLITFAEDSTRIYGELSAQGGFEGGNGGFIETSGLAGFDIGSVPNAGARAESGTGGEWLIDPFDITIGSGNNNNQNTIENTYESTGEGAFLSVQTISAALNSGDVTVQTGGTSNQDGNITLVAALGTNRRFNGEATLTLRAHNTITLNAIIDNTQESPLNIVLVADSDATGAGDVIVNGSINTAGGDITMGEPSNNRFPANINTNGTLNVSGPDGAGRIELYAVNDIVLGEIDISSTTNESTASFIEARSSLGSITLNNGLDYGDTGFTDEIDENFTSATLFLSAANDVVINEEIADSDGGNRDTLNVILLADADGDNVGVVDLNNNIFTGHGNIIVSGAGINFEAQDGFVSLNTDDANAGEGQDAPRSLGGSVFLRSSSDLDLGEIVTNNDSIVEGEELVFGDSGTSFLGAGLENFASDIDDACRPGTACGNLWVQGRNDGDTINVTQGAGTRLAVFGDTEFDLGFDLDNQETANLTLNQSVAFTGALHILSANNVDINTSNALHLGNIGSVEEPLNSLDVRSSNLDSFDLGSEVLPVFGAIVVAGTTTLNTPNQDITLNSTSNDFNELVIEAADNVEIREANTVALGGGANAITTNFEIVAEGAITGVEGQPINVIGTSRFSSGGDITLTDAQNDFSRVHILAANNVALSDANALILGDNNLENPQGIELEGNLSLDVEDTVSVYSEQDLAVFSITARAIGIEFDSAFTLIEDGSIAGSTVNISGNEDANTFNLEPGSSFTGLTTFAGGAGDDVFNISPTGAVTFANSANFNGGEGADTFNISSLTFADSETATAIFSGRAGEDIFNLSSSNENFTFDGGNDSDQFNLNSASLAGEIVGGTGAGTDTIIGPVANITWALGGLDGSQGDSVAGVSFSDVEALVGRNGVDTFNITADYNGTVEGGDNNDVFNLSADVTVSVSGGSGNDEFTILASGLAFTLFGEDGSDTLSAFTDDNTWVLSRDAGGTLNSNAFFGFQNLVGNSGVDTFILSSASSSVIDGGQGDAIDQITVGDIGESLTLLLGASINNIERVKNDSGNTDYVLAVSSGINTWNIEDFDLDGTLSDGVDDGTLNSSSPSVGEVQFVNFSNILGGEGDDTFIYTRNEITPAGDEGTPAIFAEGQLTGTLNGGAGGSNTVDMSQLSAVDVSVDDFTGMNTFIGNASNSTLTGSSVETSWRNLRSTGTILSGIVDGMSFSEISQLIGGEGDDTFVFDGSSNESSISIAAGEGNDTVDFSGVDEAQTITVGTDNLFGISGVESFIGNNLSTFSASNTVNEWLIDGDNSGIVNGQNRFQNFGILSGGSDTDNFTFSAEGSLSLTAVQGGGGVDQISLAGIDGGVNWEITALSGNVASGNVAGRVSSFQNFESFVGSAGDNTLTANYGDAARTWSIDSSENGFNGRLDNFEFSGMDKLAGNDAVDTFLVSSTALTGTLDGGNGTAIDILAFSTPSAVEVNLSSLDNAELNLDNIDEIQGPDGQLNTLIGAETNSWQINTQNGGSFAAEGGLRILFSNFAILQGGSGADRFNFSGDGSLSVGGYIDGVTGTDSLIIEDSVGAIQSVLLTSTATGSALGTTLSVANIDSITNNIDSLGLNGFNGNNNWNISSAENGTIQFSDSNVVAFSGFSRLVGQGGDDSFTFADGAYSLFTLSGNGGNDTANFAAITQSINLSLDTGADNSEFILDGIETVVANPGQENTLLGFAEGATWQFDNNNTGNGNLSQNGQTQNTEFSGVTHLLGGAGDDIFTSLGAWVSGVVEGGAGQDTVDFSGFSASGRTVALVESVDSDLSGADIYLANIENLNMSADPLNTLLGAEVNTWQIDTQNGGSVAADDGSRLSFTNIAILQGGSGADTFTFSNDGRLSAGGYIDGVTGTNSVIMNGTVGAIESVVLASTATGSALDTVLSVANIESIANNVEGLSLSGFNGNNTWNISSAENGTIQLSDGNVVAFSGFNRLVGQGGDDSFTFADDTYSLFTLSGNGGNDTANFAGITQAINLSLDTSADNSEFILDGFETVIANPNRENNLLGFAEGASWQFDQSNTGSGNLTQNGQTQNTEFSGFTHLLGGTGDDCFTSSGAWVLGVVDGGAGQDTVDFSGFNAAGRTVALVESVDSDLFGADIYLANTENLNMSAATVNTLVAFETNTWQIDTENGGAIAAENGSRLSFSQFAILQGGSGTDTFTFSGDGSLSAGGYIQGSTGIDSLIIEGSASAIQGVELASTGTGSTSDTVLSVVNIERITNNVDALSLTGFNGNNSWTIAENGTIQSLDSDVQVGFSGFSRLVGQGGNDTYVFDELPSGAPTITILAGEGNDTVDFSGLEVGQLITVGTNEFFGISGVESFIGNNLSTFSAEGETNNWLIDGDNAGILNGQSFRNFGTIVGGSGTDNFTFSATGSLSQTAVQGGGGDDQISLAEIAGEVNWAVSDLNSNGAARGEVVGLVSSFQDIENVIGGTGTNTLTANTGDAERTWSIDDGENGFNGRLDNFDFTNMDILVGNNAVDTFLVSSTALSGTLDGGNGSAIDMLAFSSASPAVEVNLSSAENALDLRNIEAIQGPADGATALLNTLIGFDANTWEIDTQNGGSVAADDGNRIAFTNFAILQGGSGTDTFRFSADGSLSAGGYIDGVTGTDALTIEDTVGAIQGVVLAPSGTGSTVDTVLSVANIGRITNNVDGLSLSGLNNNTTWTVAENNSRLSSGTIEVTFSGFTHLLGGAGDDDFISTGAWVSGVVDGGAGQDTADLSLRNSNVSVALVANADSNLSGADIYLANIEALELSTGPVNTLASQLDNNFNWVLNASNAGVIRSASDDNTDQIIMAFSGVDNVVGGAADDLFDFAENGALSGFIDGGEGFDTVSMKNQAVVNFEIGTDNAYINIELYTGNNENSTIGTQGGSNNWEITAENSGTLNGDIVFNGFTSLSGGSADDTFNIRDGGTLAGEIRGNGGSDELNITLGDSLSDQVITFIGGDADKINVDGGSNIVSSRYTLEAGTDGNGNSLSQIEYSDDSARYTLRYLLGENAEIHDDANAETLVINGTAGVDTLRLVDDTFSVNNGLAVNYSNKANLLIPQSSITTADTLVVAGAVNFSQGTVTVENAQLVSENAAAQLQSTALYLQGTASTGTAEQRFNMNVDDLYVSGIGSGTYLQEADSVNIAELATNSFFDLLAQGDISGGAALTAQGATTMESTAGSVALPQMPENQLQNIFSGPLTLAASGNITIFNSTTTTLAGVSAGRNFVIYSEGVIDADAPVVVGGTTNITAGGNARFSHENNDFLNTVVVERATSIDLVDQNLLTLGSVNLSGLLTSSSEGLNINGAMTLASATLNAGESTAQIASSVKASDRFELNAEGIRLDAAVTADAIVLNSHSGVASLNANVIAGRSMDVRGEQILQTTSAIVEGGGAINLLAVTGIGQGGQIIGDDDVTLVVENGDITMARNARTVGAAIAYSGDDLVLENLTGKSIRLAASNTVTQNSLVQATGENIQITANTFSMGESAWLDASEGDIAIEADANVQVGTLNAGGNISIKAFLMNVQDTMRANTIALTTREGITLDGALAAEGSIDLHTDAGEINQLQDITSSGDVTIRVQEGGITMGADVSTQGNSLSYVAQNLVLSTLTGNEVVLTAENSIEQNGVVHALTENIQINATTYTMGENAGLGSTQGDIVVKTANNAQLQALSAGGHISVDADEISIQDTITANDITITGTNGVNVNGALDARGDINVHASQGNVNQFQTVSARGNIEISAANTVRVSAETEANNINMAGAEALVLESNLKAQENIALSSANGNIEQSGWVSAEGNIIVDANIDITMQADALLEANNGEINMRAGQNMTVAQVNAGSEGHIIAQAINGEIVDGNTDALNFMGKRLQVTASTGIGHAKNLELSVAELALSNFENKVQVRNNKSLRVDQLLNNGDVWLTSSEGNISFNNYNDRVYDPTQTDGNLTRGLLDTNYNMGNLVVLADAGNIVGLGAPRTDAPDIVAKNVTLWAPTGSVGAIGRPLVVYAQDTTIIRGVVSYKPFWAFDTPPRIFSNESLQIDITDLLGSGGEEMVEVEQVEEINPAVFTRVRNFSYDEVSVSLPEDQLFDDELKERRRQDISQL